MKVLIAEDDPVSRAFLKRLLEKRGHTVTACVDGSDAWNAYNRDDFGLVVSDWMMPGMDGIELCRAIRKNSRPGYCYFIMVTAKTTKSDIAEAMKAGADDCLAKPVSPAEIAARLAVAQRIVTVTKEPSVPPPAV